VTDTQREAIAKLGMIVGLALLLFATRNPNVRGQGRSATIDGRSYVLQGAYDSRAKAEARGRALRHQWKEYEMRGSVRIIAKKYRGVGRLWTVYSQSAYTKKGLRAAAERNK
jgi:hypothetical protein